MYMIAGLKKDSSKGKSQIVKNSVPAIWQRRSALSGKEASPQGGDLYRTGRFCAGAGGRTRTGTPSLAVDFESTTSTNSITPAYNKNIIVYSAAKSKKNFAALEQNGGRGKVAQF